ncbi:class A beta-lactamase [Nocardioides sp. cx-173]|uniref:class A beta-lactamase n=1 Tax=Nocardioides sp. cx-173 TaxID=2898796 RepID=UPI001E45CC62|nr:class A beta-lactamase [Nocardioides sp. cx-173]MCD4523791.1 class A beta-lactamase [Nocardioides sp. cx-173]UGB41886.1 class A beta-lactamase [Nocardioides sp. cx-173]
MSGPSRLVLGALALVLLSAGCAATTDDGAAPPPAVPASAAPPGDAPAPAAPDVSAAFRALESRFDARLGVYAVDTGTRAQVAWRDGERFPYASTVKALATGALLDRLGVAGLDAEVRITAAEILPHSPVTERRVGSTMTLRELAAAAMTESDNAAANRLFEALGGPRGLDDALAALGDDVTTVSRTEPDLNEAIPGDERDTTTPRAIAGDLREYVVGDALGAEERRMLTAWLRATRTGDTLVRADLPADWVVGDKSGGGGYGSRGDIAVIWPTTGAPIVIAVLSTRDRSDAPYDDRLVARAAAVAVDALR